MKAQMSEPTARFTFTGACGLSAFAAMASTILGLREEMFGATIFLVFALVGSAITLYSCREYLRLRDIRWKRELKDIDDRLSQLLNHARMNIIVQHPAGPLSAHLAGQGPGPEVQEGTTVAKS